MRETWEIREDTIMSIAWETDHEPNIRLSLDSWNMHSNTELAQCTDLSQVQECKFTSVAFSLLQNSKVVSYHTFIQYVFQMHNKFFSLRYLQALHQKQFANYV